MVFQQDEDFVGQQRQICGDRLELLPRSRAGKPVQNASIEPVDLGPIRRPLPCPAGRDALLDSGGDHLGDVASAERDALADQSQRPLLRQHVLGPALELLGPRHQRAEFETERHFDGPAPPFAGEALAVRAVTPNDEAAIDQGRQMPPQGRWRHAVGAQGELLVGGKNDQSLAAQRGFRMEAQQRVENRQRALRNADPGLGRADRPEHLPLVHGLVRGPRFRRRLARHMGKRQRSPPKGRRRTMGLHFIALNWAKEIRPPKRRSISHETLDRDSRKWDSQTCHRMRRASGTPFRGPFSFALLLLTCVSYFQPRAFARDRNAVYSSSSCDATKSANSGSLRESKARLIALFDLVIVATARPDSLFQVATVGWLRALKFVAANTLKNRVSVSAFNKSGSFDACSAARLARASRSASASASHRR